MTDTGQGAPNMYTESMIDRNNTEDFYRQLGLQLDALLAGEPNPIANMSNMAALLTLHLQDINWAGFYLWHETDEELILGPFQGKPACIRIALGKGVCGSAAKRRESLVVEDVFSFPGHIFCDPASRSEVVIPIVVNEKLVGVLDIDSATPGRFHETDKIGLESLVGVFTRHTQF